MKSHGGLTSGSPTIRDGIIGGRRSHEPPLGNLLGKLHISRHLRLLVVVGEEYLMNRHRWLCDTCAIGFNDFWEYTVHECKHEV